MFYRVMRKEILENLLSLRFTLSVVLSAVLFAAIGFVFVDNYREQSAEYWRRTNANLAAFREQADQLHELAFYEHHVYRRPRVLALCSGGFEETLPGHFIFDAFNRQLPRLVGQSSPFLPRSFDMDWSFIISLIFSFVAFVFAYDCISGEKDRGTLRLILSGGPRRASILFGKYIGLMLTLGIPLLLGLLISLAVVVTSGAVAFGSDVWMRILVATLLSVLYLSIFVLLGVFVSTRTAQPAHGMALLLLIWIVLVILVPGLGRIVADRLHSSPTPEEFARILTEALQDVDEDCSAGKFGPRAGARSPDPNTCNPPARARYSNARSEAGNRVVEEYQNRMAAQAVAGRTLTAISPTVVYRRAAEVIAGTGIPRCAALRRQIKEYQSILREYIVQEDRAEPGSLHLLFDEGHSVAEWHAISQKRVDFDAVPKFHERGLRLGASLKDALWDIALLILFNLVFFAAAFVSFIRYDVR